MSPPTTKVNGTESHDHTANYVGDLFLLSLLCVIGVLGNILIIVVVLRIPNLRKISNSFIVCIAVADLIVCAYIIPTIIVHRVTFTNSFGYLGCEINAILITLCMGVSNFSFMYIALNRYFYVFHQIIYHKVFKPQWVALTIFLTVVFWICTCIGILFFQGFEYEYDAYICMFSDEVADLILSGLLTSLCVGLPSLIALICYVAMAIKIVIASKSAGGGETKGRFRREFRAIVTIFLAYMTFNICWGPYTLHIYLTHAGLMKNFPEKGMYWLCVSNSALNCLIYGLFNSKFRKGYLAIFGAHIGAKVDNAENATRSVAAN